MVDLMGTETRTVSSDEYSGEMGDFLESIEGLSFTCPNCAVSFEIGTDVSIKAYQHDGGLYDSLHNESYWVFWPCVSCTEKHDFGTITEHGDGYEGPAVKALG